MLVNPDITSAFVVENFQGVLNTVFKLCDDITNMFISMLCHEVAVLQNPSRNTEVCHLSTMYVLYLSHP